MTTGRGAVCRGAITSSSTSSSPHCDRIALVTATYLGVAMSDVRSRVAEVIDIHRRGQPSPYSDAARSKTASTAGYTLVSAEHLAQPLPPVPWLVQRLDVCPG